MRHDVSEKSYDKALICNVVNISCGLTIFQMGFEEKNWKIELIFAILKILVT